MKFLIHFVGDIHQPLHCATNADAGGNCINTRGFGQSELHAVWDTGLVSLLHGKGSNKKDNAGAAKDLNSEFASKFDEWSARTDEQRIALESHEIAFSVAYAPILPKLPAPEPRPFKLVIPFACKEAPDFKKLPAIDVTTLYDDATKRTVREPEPRHRRDEPDVAVPAAHPGRVCGAGARDDSRAGPGRDTSRQGQREAPWGAHAGYSGGTRRCACAPKARAGAGSPKSLICRCLR